VLHVATFLLKHLNAKAYHACKLDIVGGLCADGAARTLVGALAWYMAPYNFGLERRSLEHVYLDSTESAWRLGRAEYAIRSYMGNIFSSVVEN
jgi:hypothetical protein